MRVPVSWLREYVAFDGSVEDLAELLPVTNLVMMDIKHIDSAKHRAATGVKNERILANAARLAEIGDEMGYTVRIIPPLEDEQGIISSTRIRRSIATGEMASAASELGRYYAITGSVIHGVGRGHRLNLPTANIEIPPGKVSPANGIYACWASVGGQQYQAATNVGVRPTFTPDLPVPIIEAHLLDFNHDLYGQQINLEFVEYLRPEEKYDSVDALLEQIQADIARTREILG